PSVRGNTECGATNVSVDVGAQAVSPDTGTWDGVLIGGVRLPALHGVLSQIIDSVERELGASLKDLSRNDKQTAIRLLDERGAFILRRAVEDVADAMGVSRITVYNYLNALHR
ncbi:MAG: helix-turn-helix domain-containing protein, partial [Actinomycetota bacterium]